MLNASIDTSVPPYFDLVRLVNLLIIAQSLRKIQRNEIKVLPKVLPPKKFFRHSFLEMTSSRRRIAVPCGTLSDPPDTAYKGSRTDRRLSLHPSGSPTP